MLSIVEGRVVGCLLEKERTVPDQYPLTLNALVAACNQSTAREPVMHVAEHEVLDTLGALEGGGIGALRPSVARPQRHPVPAGLRRAPRSGAAGDRAPRACCCCVGRRPRPSCTAGQPGCYDFGSAADVEAALHGLAERELVRLTDRQPGQSAARWQQLVAEEADVVRTSGAEPAARHQPSSAALTDRLVELEARVARLESALADLL